MDNFVNDPKKYKWYSEYLADWYVNCVKPKFPSSTLEQEHLERFSKEELIDILDCVMNKSHNIEVLFDKLMKIFITLELKREIKYSRRLLSKNYNNPMFQDIAKDFFIGAVGGAAGSVLYDALTESTYVSASDSDTDSDFDCDVDCSCGD